jgi:hypothetical protein
LTDPSSPSFFVHSTAVILALDAEKAEATVKFYGYPDVESKPLSDLALLRPAPGAELAPGQATVGFECEVRFPYRKRQAWRAGID